MTRVVAVDANPFKVISHSVKKTDPNDARNPALYLSKDLLPEVRMKDKTQAQPASLTQTWDTLARLRTSLKNKINNILSTHGINLEKEALSSGKKLNEVLAMKFDPMIRSELKIIVEQIRSLSHSIAELEKTIAEEGSKLEGHNEFMDGICDQSFPVPDSPVINTVASDASPATRRLQAETTALQTASPRSAVLDCAPATAARLHRAPDAR